MVQINTSGKTCFFHKEAVILPIIELSVFVESLKKTSKLFVVKMLIVDIFHFFCVFI